MKPNDDGVTVGEENFSWNKEAATLKEVTISHIRKLSEISCQELTAGYFDEKPIRVGEGFSVIRTYHPDLREAYINGVDFLLILVRHCIAQDTEGNFTEILNKLEAAENKDFDTATTEGWSKSDWVLTKLNHKKTLMKEIMLMLDRIQFFSASDGGINE